MSRRETPPVGLILLMAILVAGLLLGAGAGPIAALDTLQVEASDPLLDPWNWRTYDTYDTGGWIRGMYEDQEGAIWFGTNNGASRYDGLDWVRYTTADGLIDQTVNSLLQTRDGAMWFGTKRGVSRLENGQWTSWAPGDGLAGSQAIDMLEARDGSIWAVFHAFGDTTVPGSGISRFDGDNWHPIELPPTAADQPWDVGHIVESTDGALWVSAWGRGVLRYDGSAWRLFTTADGLSGLNAWNLAATEDGAVWVICYDGAGGGKGLNRFDGTSWTTYAPGGSQDWQSMWQAPDGALWTGGQGALARFDGHRWQMYDLSELMSTVMPQMAVQPLVGLALRDGSMWLKVGQAAARFEPAGLNPTRYRHPDRLFGGYEDAAGGVWFHTDHAAVYHQDGRWLAHTADDGFLDGDVYGAWQAASGDVWFIGTHASQTAVARRRGDTWRVFTADDGLIEHIYADAVTDDWQSFSFRFWGNHCAETRQGEIWIGGAHEGQAAVCRLVGDRWERHVLPGGRVTQALAASDGSLWFGTWDGEASVDGGGLHHYDGADWHRYDETNGLTSSRVYGIAEWPAGTMWVGVLNGVSRRALSAAPDAPWQPVADRWGGNRKLGGFVPTSQGVFFKGYGQSGGGAPSVFRHDGETLYSYPQHGLRRVSDLQAADGAVWVSGAEGLSRFIDGDWSRLTAADGVDFTANMVAAPNGAPVQWEAIHATSAGGLWISSADGVLTHLSSLSRFKTPETRLLPSAVQVSSAGNIQLQWSSGDRWKWSRPSEIRYQWRVDGGPWSATSQRTEVTLTELPPEGHTFDVRAFDRHGSVDPTPAQHIFSVETPWYGNPWVRGLGAIFLALTLFLLSRVVQSNRELRRLNQQLQQVSGYKSDFLARMSHDLRTPMNAIIGYTRILLRRTVDDLDPRMFRNLENIHTSADHLLVLINDILDLSRIEAGRIDLTPVATDVRALVEGCIIAVAPLVRDGVELRQDLVALPPAHLDPERLRRIVVNLLGNAAKFTETGTITVSLRTTNGDAGNRLELIVADTGIGIPPEDLPHVFEEFRQVNGAGNAQEGSGLGLSIARRSIELMGGTIAAESIVGQGSTFTVRLPGPSSGDTIA